MSGLTEQTVIDQLLSYDGVKLDDRTTDKLAIYSYDGEIVAVIKKGSQPINLSLRCDYNLGKLLREQYESVLEGQSLNKKRFITILLTGQMSDNDVRDQIRHAYEETKKLVAWGCAVITAQKIDPRGVYCCT